MNRYYYIFSKNANDFYHTTVFYSIITQGILQTHLIQKKKINTCRHEIFFWKYDCKYEGKFW